MLHLQGFFRCLHGSVLDGRSTKTEGSGAVAIDLAKGPASPAHPCLPLAGLITQRSGVLSSGSVAANGLMAKEGGLQPGILSCSVPVSCLSLINRRSVVLTASMRDALTHTMTLLVELGPCESGSDKVYRTHSLSYMLQRSSACRRGQWRHIKCQH